MSIRIAGSLALIVCLLLPAAAQADDGDVIVRFRSTADASERADTRRDADVRRQGSLPMPGLELVEPEAGVSASAAAAELNRDRDVLYAEPDAPRRALVVPSDRYFRAQWGLENVGQTVGGSAGTADADIDAPEAWDLSTGSPGVTVAVIDSGIDLGHPDLAPNLFQNAGEIAANDIDDDRNGFVDDVTGWDFFDSDATPNDENGHGTHVAGTVAARGNDGVGVTGVAWATSILPLRSLGPDGSGNVSDTIRAYSYAAEAGAEIINLSLGGDSSSRTEREAIASAAGVLFVAAAGNDGADNDTTASYPCNYDLPNVVCVAATDRSDGLAGFSNFGGQTVDLAAPGVAIASTYLDGKYALLDGTSMATPHVSGVAALLFALDPALSMMDARSALLTTVDPVGSLAGRTVTGGRLNAANALAAVARKPVPVERTTTEPPPGAASEPPADEGSPDATSEGGASGPPPSASEPAPVIASPKVLPDRSPPMVTFSLTSPRTIATFIRRGLRASIRCPEACRLSTRLRRGSRTLATRSAARTSAGSVGLTLRPSRATLSSLRSARSVGLTFHVTATDAAGNRHTVTRRLTLRR